MATHTGQDQKPYSVTSDVV